MSSPESLCRICLKASKNLLKFHQNMTETERISERYENFTGIKIKINESESRICKLCFETLKSSSEFKKLCIENDERYRDLLSNTERNTRSNDNLEKIEMVLIKEEIDYSSDDNNQADYHEENYESLEEHSVPIPIKQEVKKEIKKEPSNTNVKKKETGKKLPCAYCGKHFSTQKDRRKHEKRVHLTTYYCDHCPITYKRKDSIISHVLQHVGIRKVRCKLCKKLFCHKSEVRNHLRKVHFEKNENGENVKKEITTEVCPFCGKVFEGQYPEKSCNMHIKKVHTDTPKKKKVRTTDKGSGGPCAYCGKHFSTQKDRRKHELRVHLTKFSCDLCPVTYKRKESIVAHVLQHVGIRKVRCKLCTKLFCHKSEVRDHLRKVHFEKNEHGENVKKEINNTEVCPFCGKIFKGQRPKKTCNLHILKMHTGNPDTPKKQKIKSRDKVYHCDRCGKSFKSKYKLTDHLRLHVGIKGVDCPHCDKKFVTKVQLLKHNRLIHDNRAADTINCPYCKYSCFGTKTMDNHITIMHINQRDYICEKCGSKFQSKLSYRRHMLNHERDEKGIGFQCHLCPKILKRQELLNIHLKRHAGAAEFSCMYCEKSFYQKTRLTQHVFSMHINTTFNCKICGFQMRLRAKFQKLYVNHVRDTHKYQLTKQQMEMLEIEIKKLKFQDLYPDIPASLRSN